jgi:murein DD-endopeptidase MepM/ murein hydrolase activator NlpD
MSTFETAPSKNKSIYRDVLIAVSVCMLFVGGMTVSTAFGASSKSSEDEAIEELQRQIDAEKKRIQDIDREIVEQAKLVEQVRGQKRSLENEVKTLDASARTIESSIKKTTANIKESELTISRLALEIEKRSSSIEQHRAATASLMRELNRAESTTGIEAYLSGESIIEAAALTFRITEIGDSISERIDMLDRERVEMEERAQLTSAEKAELESHTSRLANERSAVVSTKSVKDKLLSETASKESEYQRILNAKVAEKAEFERSMREYESKLAIAIDGTKFPQPGTRVLQWPLERITVTQLFGSTEFAAKNPSIYGGRPYHSGVDFGAPVGTPLFAPLSGTITHTGNTDAIPGCYSWGRWVLLKHNNGLTSLFAHLSSVSVKPGDRVETGDIIANTGNTGFSTGPHLHYTLYASEGVRVVPFSDVRKTTSCAGTVTPTAPGDAYLDALDYLPKL